MTSLMQLLVIKDAIGENMFVALFFFIGGTRSGFIKIGSPYYQWANFYDRMPSRVVHPVLRKSSNIGNTHCVAHWEALTIGDAYKAISKLMIFNDFANKVYSWVGRSCNQRKELKSLMDSFDLLSLTILQFHLLHWLFQGQVLERILYYIPTILDALHLGSLTLDILDALMRVSLYEQH